MRKRQLDTASYAFTFSSATGEKVLTGVTRVILTPKKHIPKKNKNIKSKVLSPFDPKHK